MKKLVIIFLVSLFVLSTACFADQNLTRIWNFVLLRHKLSGYPVYNAKLNRYDFYDINDAYTGSLFYNTLTDQWEVFKL